MMKNFIGKMFDFFRNFSCDSINASHDNGKFDSGRLDDFHSNNFLQSAFREGLPIQHLNPATGLPMISPDTTMGFDVGGALYGFDSHSSGSFGSSYGNNW